MDLSAPLLCPVHTAQHSLHCLYVSDFIVFLLLVHPPRLFMPVALLSRLVYSAARQPVRAISLVSFGALIPTSALIHNYVRSAEPVSPSAPRPSSHSSSAVSAAVAHLNMLPAASMPELTGRYKTIGVSTFYIQQPAAPSKPEAGSERTDEQEDERLELVVKVYYPSSTAPAPRPAGLYMTRDQSAAVAHFAHVPAFLFAHLPRIKVRAVDNADIAKPEEGTAGLPIVLFSHGLGGIPETYTVQACELASRGFVVMLPYHNDRSACLSVLPDGRRIEYERPPGTDDKKFRSAQLVKRVKELTFLLDNITSPALNTLPFEASALQTMPAHLDRSQVSLIGHSFGAATSIATASFEQMTADKQGHQPRVKAVISHDQWMEPVHELVQPVRLRVPTFITISEGFYKWDGNYHPLRDLYHSFPQPSTSRMLMIEGSAHSNFSDVGLFNATLTKWAGSIGSIDHVRCWQMLDDVNSGWCGRWMGVAGEGEQDVLDAARAPAQIKYLS